MTRTETVNQKLDYAQTAIIDVGWALGWRCESVELSHRSCSRYMAMWHPDRGKLRVRISNHTSPFASPRKVRQLDVLPILPGSLATALRYLRS